jgi:hypothetical protein
VIHYGCALAFILSLAVITVFFGIRDGARRTSGQKLSPTFWRYYHWFLAAVIALAVLWLIANEAADWKYGWRVIEQSVLIGEWVAVAAFALSWFFKGEEWEMLRQRRTRAEATREPAVPSG